MVDEHERDEGLRPEKVPVNSPRTVISEGSPRASRSAPGGEQRGQRQHDEQPAGHDRQEARRQAGVDARLQCERPGREAQAAQERAAG